MQRLQGSRAWCAPSWPRRFLRGVPAKKEERHLPSRFITELPSECIQEIRLRGTVTRALNQAKVGSLSTSLPENEWKIISIWIFKPFMGQKI